MRTHIDKDRNEKRTQINRVTKDAKNVFIYLHQVTIVFIHIEKADIQSKKVQLLNETKL